MGISNKIKCGKICPYHHIRDDQNVLTILDRTKVWALGIGLVVSESIRNKQNVLLPTVQKL